MDYFFDEDEMNNYNNYVDIRNINRFPFVNIKEISYGNNFYFKDKMIFEANTKKRKRKNKINSMDQNIYNLLRNNNKNEYNNKINNNFEKRKGKKELLYNKNYYNNRLTMDKNRDNQNITQVSNYRNNQIVNTPFIYQPKYPKDYANNNNLINRNKNNQFEKINYLTLKDSADFNNHRNINFNQIYYKNNNHSRYHMNIKRKKQIKSKISKNKRYLPQKLNMNNNIIINNNNCKNQINKSAAKEENRRIITKSSEDEDEKNFSNIAEELLNFCAKKNIREKKNLIRTRDPNQCLKNLSKDKEEIKNDIKSQPSINNKVPKFEPEYKEVKCNQINLPEKIVDKENRNDEKPRTKEVGIGIQYSLMQYLQIECYNKNGPDNGINDNTKEKIEADETEKEKNISINAKEKEKEKENPPSNKRKQNPVNDKEENKPSIIENNDFNSERIFGEDSKGSFNISKRSIGKEDTNKSDKREKIEEDFELGGKLIESDNETKKKRKDRRIKFDTSQNVYFDFLKGGLINDCQFRKGVLGEISYFKPKNNIEIFDSHVVFMPKPSIRPFRKEEIRVDKDYKLREEMSEYQIIPDLFDFEENANISDDEINELANSLRGSIDKSTSAELNNSLRNSITQSYNQSIMNSLITSSNNEGQSILQKLKLTFEGSVNQMNK